MKSSLLFAGSLIFGAREITKICCKPAYKKVVCCLWYSYKFPTIVVS